MSKRANLIPFSLIIMAAITSAPASAQSCAFSAVDASLKREAEIDKASNPNNREEAAGLIKRQTKCPPMERGGALEYVDKFQVVSVTENVEATLIDTHQCGGGNKHGQYLVIARSNQCHLVRKPAIGDMSFIATEIYAGDTDITLSGLKWQEEDAHCCPSKKATLTYNAFTGSYKFQLEDLKQ